MSDIVGTFRSYAHDKDNMPRMETEVVYVRVKHLLEAAAEIDRLRAALSRRPAMAAADYHLCTVMYGKQY